MGSNKSFFLLLVAFCIFANAAAHFLVHPGRFGGVRPEPAPENANVKEERESDSANSNSNSHSTESEETAQPTPGYGFGKGHDNDRDHHDHAWGGKGKHSGGFPRGMKIDERTLEILKAQIKQELELEGNEEFQFKDFKHDREHHHSDEDEEDFDLDWDDEVAEHQFPTKIFDAAGSAKTWKREFGFSKILAISKNGTRTFIKTRESTRVEVSGDVSISGGLNTTLNIKGSVSGSFAINATYSSKGKDTKTTAKGDATSSSTSSSKWSKDRLLSKSTIKTDGTIKSEENSNADPIKVTSVVNSKSETFPTPFRTFLTLFASTVNSTTKAGGSTSATNGVLKGESHGHVVFAKKGASLTKVKVKAYMTSKTGDAYKQLILVKSKSHIWVKFAKKTEDGDSVVDVYTTTKTRVYGKGKAGKNGDRVYYGTGVVQCQKTQVTLSSEESEELNNNNENDNNGNGSGNGIHMNIVHNGLSGNGFIHAGLMSSLRI
jgi:hypothetical protein